MIQRIQSVYLIVSVIAVGLFLLSGLPAESDASWQAYLIYGLGAAVIAAQIIALVNWKDQHRQRLMITVGLAELVVFSGVAYAVLYFSGSIYFRSTSGTDIMRLLELIYPVVAYVTTRLALAGVKRDIKLVESANRLR